MSEELKLTPGADKEKIYQEIIPQIKALVDYEDNLIANLANVAAVLTQSFNHLWTGFYLREGKGLVLGPFQGPLACSRIPVAPTPRGVCGVAAATKETQIVPDVNVFSGHIACSSASQSEIVVPLVANDQTQLVLDIDSAYLDSFDVTDQLYLEQIIEVLRDKHYLA